MSLVADIRDKLTNLAFLGFHPLIPVNQQLKSDFQMSLVLVMDSNGSSIALGQRLSACDPGQIPCSESCYLRIVCAKCFWLLCLDKFSSFILGEKIL